MRAERLCTAWDRDVLSVQCVDNIIAHRSVVSVSSVSLRCRCVPVRLSSRVYSVQVFHTVSYVFVLCMAVGSDSVCMPCKLRTLPEVAVRTQTQMGKTKVVKGSVEFTQVVPATSQFTLGNFSYRHDPNSYLHLHSFRKQEN